MRDNTEPFFLLRAISKKQGASLHNPQTSC